MWILATIKLGLPLSLQSRKHPLLSEQASGQPQLLRHLEETEKLGEKVVERKRKETKYRRTRNARKWKEGRNGGVVGAGSQLAFTQGVERA